MLGRYRVCRETGYHEIPVETIEPKWFELREWCAAYTSGEWQDYIVITGLLDHRMGWFRFKEKDDLVLFKLRWHGEDDGLEW